MPFLLVGKWSIGLIHFSALPYWEIDWGSNSSACALLSCRFLQCLHAFKVEFRDVGVLLTRFPFSWNFPPKEYKETLCFPLEGFFIFLLMSFWTSICPLRGFFCPRVLGRFIYGSFPCLFGFSSILRSPFSFSNVYFLVGIFFSKGNSHFSVFSFVRKFFWIPGKDSFLPDPFKSGVRVLVGWKIFVPSRGEFGLGSFPRPPF